MLCFLVLSCRGSAGKDNFMSPDIPRCTQRMRETGRSRGNDGRWSGGGREEEGPVWVCEAREDHGFC